MGPHLDGVDVDKPPRNIVAVHPSAELYGADRILAECLASIPRADITLIIPREGPLIAYLAGRLPNINVVVDRRLPIVFRKLLSIRGSLHFMRNIIYFGMRLRTLNKQLPIHLLYVSTTQTFAVSLLARMFRVPCIVHVHEIIEHPAIVFEVTSNVIARCASRVICVSNAVRQNLMRSRTALARADKFVVVHNGIDGFYGMARSTTEIREKKIVFSLFGRIKPEKGQWLLIEALRLLSPHELGRIEVNIVGSALAGSEYLERDLLNRIRGAHLADVVSVLPFREDISDILRASDVCLVPSIMQDPFPTTVLEAMSAGKLIIAAAQGGIVEMLTHEVDGLLIQPGSAESLASCISLVLNRIELIEALGVAAQRKFQEMFTAMQFRNRFCTAGLGGVNGESSPTF
jgi:glycosyltransferase involved in cell wall biosynthesis